MARKRRTHRTRNADGTFKRGHGKVRKSRRRRRH